LALASLALASSPALADQVRNHEWWLAKLHVTDAWQSSRGAGITVAVLDTGVESTQPDLVGSVISGPDYTNSGRPAGGPFWGARGTAIASLIAGHGHGTDASAGIVGIAPEAKILSVRVTLESRDPLLADPAVAGKLPLAIAHGIKFAVQHGATVIELPLDPLARPGAAVAAGAIAAERAAVAYAISKRVVLVAPAGDIVGGTDRKNYPAAFPGVISVGAFNSQFVKAKYSSHQPYVTVTAAGDGVMAADPAGYATLHSTSAASAVVAGIVALIRAQFPTLTPSQVTRVLTSSTVYRPPGGTSRGSGYGTVDAARALASAAQMAELVPTSTPGAATGVAPPTPPGVYSLNGNLRKTLAIDGAISAAVFLVLLMIILLFRQLRRRRARAARLAEVRAAARVQARRSKEAASAGAGATEFMPAPLGRTRSPAAGSLFAGSGLPGSGLPASGLTRAGLPGPAGPGAGLPGSAPPGTPGLPDTGTVRPAWGGASSVLPENAAPAGSGRPGGDSPYASRPGISGGSPGISGGPPGISGGPPGISGGQPGIPGGSSGGLGLGPSRTSAARVPKVSGSPPWEPAEKPQTELPWVQSVRPAGGTRPTPPRPEREQKSWDSIAE
ncbi:MAG TPA: S8 family serine peptidase, partial [Streptosporangiaceae bacterium]